MTAHQFIIKAEATAKEALDKINKEALPSISLFVYDPADKITGALTEGDIRRGLLDGKALSEPVTEFMNRTFRYFEKTGNNYKKLKEFKALNIKYIPVLDHEMKLISVQNIDEIHSNIPATALLMAGGLGERLRPLTAETPKPLLKVGDKTIIDYNILGLQKHGINDFFVSLRYKAEMIRDHLNQLINEPSSVKFIHETDPRGTAGALSELKDIQTEYVILMNSDLLTNIDFSVLYEKLMSSNADMVMATIPYNIDVPYAIVEIDNEDKILALTEKPRYTYYANAGIYFMKKEVIGHVPKHGKYDATDLTEALISKGLKVVSQPILGYWLDIGRHEDYAKAQNDIKYLQF
ncbi:MAG TPA: sugar phosphate nucleotidyltransferase [Bacteroidia bacterium]|jgi:dTDP-glucose pyrophosphorylase